MKTEKKEKYFDIPRGQVKHLKVKPSKFIEMSLWKPKRPQ